MLILFLDDQDIRHEVVEKYLSKSHTVLHAFNADEAIQIIQSSQHRIGLALLDHDLMDFVDDKGNKVEYNYPDRAEKHGMYFLQKLFENVDENKLPAEFIIHSYNPNGCESMYKYLIANNQTASILKFSGEMITNLLNRITPQ